MKFTNMLLIFFLAISSISAQSVSPEIVSSAGDSYIGNSVQLDWTLGEVSVSTLENGSILLTEGFHQPNYSILSSTKVSKAFGKIEVYPSPTSKWIDMSFNFTQPLTINIQLFAANGMLILEKELHGQELMDRIPVENLPNGNYYLKAIVNEKEYLQTFKVQKIN